MKLKNKVLSIICVILVFSLVILHAIYFKNASTKDDENIIAINEEEIQVQEFSQERIDAINAYQSEEYWKAFEQTDQGKELSATKSYIKGYSALDLLKLGLKNEEGTDSDHDGLSDKDELLTYKTDPLKKSTSGDLFSDGYKIQNNMDVTKTYDLKDAPEGFTLSFPNNLCKNVYLKTENISDLEANVINYNSILINTDLEDILDIYSICCFSGEMSIVLDGEQYKDIETEDISIYMQNISGEIEEIDFSAPTSYEVTNAANSKTILKDEKIITLNKTFDYYSPAFIYITKKQSSNIIEKIKGIFSLGKAKNTVVSNIKEKIECLSIPEDIDKISAFYTIKWPQWTSKCKVTLYYTQTNNEEINKRIIEHAKTEVLKYVKESIPDENENWIEIIPTTKIDVELQYQKYKWLPNIHLGFGFITNASKEVVEDNNKLNEVESKIKDEVGEDLSEENEDYRDLTQIGLVFEKIDGGIELNEKEKENSFEFTLNDIFPFQNCSSMYGDGGLCAGFAQITSIIYNNNGLRDTDINKSFYTGSTYYISKGEGKDKKISHFYASTRTIPIKIDEKNSTYQNMSVAPASIINNNTQTVFNLAPYKDNELKTLFDKGIHDFKDETFTKSKTNLYAGGLFGKNLSKADSEFLKMLHYMWLKVNEKTNNYEAKNGRKLPLKSYKDAFNKKDEKKDNPDLYLYSSEFIDSIIYNLNKGKVLTLTYETCNVSNPDLVTGGHAVNIYGYDEITDLINKDNVFYDEGNKETANLLQKIYVLRLYDSNIPYSNEQLEKEETMMLIPVCINGKLYYTFKIEYNIEGMPIIPLNPETSSHLIMVLDDNYRILNK